MVRAFLGPLRGGHTAFRQALELEPGQVDATLNLGEAELALGRTREARNHFQKVLRQIEKNRPPAGLSPEASMTKAQCLAHLGRRQGGGRASPRGPCEQNPDDPYILQSAALVYALVGDRASALVNIQNALQKGVKPHWFRLPAFASLRNDPEFRDMLRKRRGAPSVLDPSADPRRPHGLRS